MTRFFEPFHFYVWFVLFLLVLTIVCCFYASYVFGVEMCFTQNTFTLTNSIITVCGSLISQGSSVDPKSASSRTTLLISFLLSVVIISSFSATLTSQLAVYQLTLPFTRLDEVITSGYKIGCTHGSAHLEDFLFAPEGSDKRIIADKKI